MRRKGFTLVELLVVIAIIALLMGILMPALAKVRQIAYRMMCGTNLSGIGKSISVYAQSNDGRYPVSGSRSNQWTTAGQLTEWDASTPTDAWGITSGSISQTTITSCLYLLVKYGSVPTKQFVCKGDLNTKEFQISDVTTAAQDLENQDVWDFGPRTTSLGPGFYCSYSYHMPFNFPHDRPLAAESSALSPLCADRNPYLDRNATSYIDGQNSGEDPPGWLVAPGTNYLTYVDNDRTGNAAAHQREGQNVLYNDGHIRFEKYPNVGIAGDNIWKYWPTAPSPTLTPQQIQLGNVGPSAAGNPSDVGQDATWATPTGQMNPTTFATTEDAYLVNETNY
jgi:prepilin-type N-terminal cleavage/methylation domain-containing protein